MQEFELTFSQVIHSHLQSGTQRPAQEVERLTDLARQLELGQIHVSSLDHGDLVVMCELLETLKSQTPQLEGWRETFGDDWNRRVHGRSNC